MIEVIDLVDTFQAFTPEAVYDNILRKFQTTDPAHADVFNAVIQQLINNDTYLKNNGGATVVLSPIGNGASDSAQMQKAANLATTKGGVYIRLMPGQYNQTEELFVKSNTTIFSEPGVEILRKHQGYMILNGDRNIPAPSSYGGHGNIRIIGGVWDAKGAVQAGRASIFHFGHGKNIRVYDTTLKDCRESHHIEFNACQDAIVQGNRIVGFYGAVGGVEAIQMDVAYPTLNNNRLVTILPADGAPCKDITIEDNYFGPSGTVGTSDLPLAIGAHNALIGKKSNNIHILNNKIYNTQTIAMRTYHWDNVVIKDNLMVDCGAGIQVRPARTDDPKDTITVNGTQTNASEFNENITVENNTIINGCDFSYPIIIYGEATGRVRNVSINKNKVYQNAINTKWAAIYLTYCDDAEIIGNKVDGSGGYGIMVNDTSTDVIISANKIRNARVHGICCQNKSKTITITGNIIKRAGRSGILLDDEISNVSITGNVILGVNGNPESGDDATSCAYIKAVNSCKGIAITGNRGANASGYSATYAIFITSTNEEISRAGNNFYGLTTLITSPSTANGTDL